jgi:hypothetical protein
MTPMTSSQPAIDTVSIQVYAFPDVMQRLRSRAGWLITLRVALQAVSYRLKTLYEILTEHVRCTYGQFPVPLKYSMRTAPRYMLYQLCIKIKSSFQYQLSIKSHFTTPILMICFAVRSR